MLLVIISPSVISNTDVICNQLFLVWGSSCLKYLLVAEQSHSRSDVPNHFAAPSTQMFLTCLVPQERKETKRRGKASVMK